MKDEGGRMKDEEGRGTGAPEDLKTRTKRFALEVIRLYSSLPKSAESQVIGRQMLRSGTSVGAQYRQGARSRSNAEVISKLESALQELEETRYWLELLAEAALIRSERLTNLFKEADELTAILVTCVKKVKARHS
jgi:four helix bundle protein